jgi:hypothetical protein
VATKKKAPESHFTVQVNGASLTGEKRRGMWTFTCPDWPELAERHRGDADLDAMLSDFMGRALAGGGHDSQPGL